MIRIGIYALLILLIMSCDQKNETSYHDARLDLLLPDVENTIEEIDWRSDKGLLGEYNDDIIKFRNEKNIRLFMIETESDQYLYEVGDGQLIFLHRLALGGSANRADPGFDARTTLDDIISNSDLLGVSDYLSTAPRTRGNSSYFPRYIYGYEVGFQIGEMFIHKYNDVLEIEQSEEKGIVGIRYAKWDIVDFSSSGLGENPEDVSDTGRRLESYLEAELGEAVDLLHEKSRTVRYSDRFMPINNKLYSIEAVLSDVFFCYYKNGGEAFFVVVPKSDKYPVYMMKYI